MQNNNLNSWKDSLLKSSLLLEHSICRILLKLGFNHPLEYNFSRKNKENVISNFSIDILVKSFLRSNDIKRTNLNLIYMFECKYCTPDTNWIFTPTSNGFVDDNLSIGIDLFDSDYAINYDNLEFLKTIPVVGKGTSLRHKGADATQIKDAYNQLAYAYIHYFIENLSWEHTETICIIPIVVTTANLWRIKEDIMLDDIYKIDRLEDFCEKCNILCLHSDPDTLMKQYFIEQYNQLDDKIKQNLKSKFKNLYFFKEDFSALIEFDPSRFFIINYKYFEQEFSKLDKNLYDSNILIKRDKY